MRFKLDQNLGSRTQELYRAAGHDVETVRSEGLSGAADEVIYQVCRIEGRCLITLDLDFANIHRYPPLGTAGIAVLRPGPHVTPRILATLAQQVLSLLSHQSIEGSLWVVEPGRIRIHEPDTDST